jgi:hypothetical protein
MSPAAEGEAVSGDLGVCWSCEEEGVLVPVMFPESPAADAPLKRHWWCEECTAHWLGESAAHEAVIETTGVVESLQGHGCREVQS